MACTGPFAVWVGRRSWSLRDDGFTYMEPVPSAGCGSGCASGTHRVVLATWQVAFRESAGTSPRVRVGGLPVRVVIPSPGADEYAAALAEQVLDAVAVWAVRTGRSRRRPVGAALVRRLRGAALACTAAATAHPNAGRDAVPRMAGGRPGCRATQETGGRGAEAATAASMLGTGETPAGRPRRRPALPGAARAAGGGAAAASGGPCRWGTTRRSGGARCCGTSRTARPERRGRWPATPSTRTPRLAAADLAPALRMVGVPGGLRRLRGARAAAPVAPHPRVPDARSASGCEALRGFKYWIDQPGLDAMCYFTENHQLVWHTAELLVGRGVGRTSVFGNTGWTGRQHAEHGRELALEWMRRKLARRVQRVRLQRLPRHRRARAGGLVEFAGTARLRRLAEALLDKVLLTLAANSWRGVHGAAHGRSYTPTLRSARFEETAPIMWALWGYGALNEAVLPATALATARAYRLPPRGPGGRHRRCRRSGRAARSTAASYALAARPARPPVRLGPARLAHAGRHAVLRAGLPRRAAGSAGAHLGRDARPGGAGLRDPPAADTISSSARPNAGPAQRVLPRARQHRDAVLSVHGLPSGTSPGPVSKTHVWFPAAHMDEVVTRGPWLAGRVGEGYVAVAVDRGLVPTTRGGEAHQEWEPRGDGRAIVTTVGRAVDDGSFADFVAELADPEFIADVGGAPRVRWMRHGRVLDLGWEGPFSIDGFPDGLSADGVPEEPPHLSNPAVHVTAGAERLEASWGGHRMVLDLAVGRRLQPASATRSRPWRRRRCAVPGEDLANALLAAPPRPPVPVEAVTQAELARTGTRWRGAPGRWACTSGFGGGGVPARPGAHRARPGCALPQRRARLAGGAGARWHHGRARQPPRARAPRWRSRSGSGPSSRVRCRTSSSGCARPERRATTLKEPWSTGPAACGPTPCSWPASPSAMSAWPSATTTSSRTAAHQVRWRHITVLQDEETGLFVHGSHRGEVIRASGGEQTPGAPSRSWNCSRSRPPGSRAG